MREMPKSKRTHLLKKPTENLIQLLRESVAEAEPYVVVNYENSWRSPKVWNDVVQYLSEINNVFNPPEVYFGLAKYFDLYSLDCFPSDQQSGIQRLISEIVEAAWNLIQLQPGARGGSSSSLACGAHEDSACVLSPWRIGLPFKDVSHAGWPTIPAKHAVNFVPSLSRQQLSGERFIRIIEKNQCPDGNWWIFGSDDPKAKRDWRSDFSVLSGWNSGDDCVELILPSSEVLNVWIGGASSQFVPNQKCILAGGGNQVWIDQKEVRRFQLPRKKKIWI